MVQAPKSLEDVSRHGGSIRAECRACGRVALFVPGELARYFSMRGWDGSWQRFPQKLRCQCGEKNPQVSWLVVDPPPSHRADRPPQPRYQRAASPIVQLRRVK